MHAYFGYNVIWIVKLTPFIQADRKHTNKTDWTWMILSRAPSRMTHPFWTPTFIQESCAFVGIYSRLISYCVCAYTKYFKSRMLPIAVIWQWLHNIWMIHSQWFLHNSKIFAKFTQIQNIERSYLLWAKNTQNSKLVFQAIKLWISPYHKNCTVLPIEEVIHRWFNKNSIAALNHKKSSFAWGKCRENLFFRE